MVRFECKRGVLINTSFFYEKNFHSEIIVFTRFLKIIEK